MINRALVAAAALLAAASAQAANLNLPVKAPATNNILTFPYNGSGIYWGVGIKAGVEQDSSTGSFLGTSLVSGDVNALGAGVGGDVGWMHGMGTTWVAVEVSAYYQNVAGSGQAVVPVGGGVSAAVPVSFASRWSSDQVVKVGGWNPFSIIGNLGFSFPTLPALPTLPGINVVPNGHTYLMVGVEEWGISGQFFTAAGTTTGVAALVGAGIMNQIVDSTGKLTGAVLDTGAQVVFADKGFQINGLFGTGAPGVGALNSGRKYEVFAKVDF